MAAGEAKENGEGDDGRAAFRGKYFNIFISVSILMAAKYAISSFINPIPRVNNFRVISLHLFELYVHVTVCLGK